MSFLQHGRKVLTALVLTLVLTFTTACGTATQARQSPSASQPNVAYSQLETGNTAAGQSFGDWVIQTSRGLVRDAYVRDNDKLGAVISPEVRPAEVRTLARSLVQGFHNNFPDRNLTVLMYAPDKQLILTAKYDNQSHQIEYQ
ncbi:MAG: hypothetical protein HC840_26340 [Leptolyngbyaceae cyanobacterium RM2_2_4]|nr:hypothetical protein [Leptolyngbyaceae cyanobacterium SM1_4_3]NJN89367.1 hypothetical protein [Leptolyngbyaceae cyanobacterium SL_5_14]NJO52329.1 hypothetical protein [Leptolyngbyaceae cyanobacterium RM2_2_4]NJO67185.1 hypothetical protein [Leptolyngbyaceae cyanobacterium RM1_405_57]